MTDSRIRLLPGSVATFLSLLLLPGVGAAECPTEPDIDDFTEHTYSVRSSGIGTFADRLVERTFDEPISEICVTIVAGDADDIGYVGALQVTNTPARCAGVGRVQEPVDVTDEVTVEGDRASLLLRAEENCCCVTGWGSATQGDRLDARLHWQVSLGPPLQVVAGFGDSPADPGTETTPAEDGLTASVPLGSVFFLQLADEDSTPIESRFSLAPATVDPIDGATLFANHVAIEFDAASEAEIKFFQAVHLGEVLATLEPTDTSIEPVQVRIRVRNPSRLGTRSDFDDLFIDLGHQRGLPPQLLKGIARRESGPRFDAEAYRYEPLGPAGDLRAISGGDNLRTQIPYSRYRLATTDGLAAGTDILDSDISPRSIYFIRRAGQLRRIMDTDQFVSALEIFRENDSFLGTKDPSVTDQRWSAFAPRSLMNRIRRDPDQLDFTAQTPLAASYGVMQMLYTTAIAPMGWTGLKATGACRIEPEECNPSFLFDTTDNIDAGGGTLALAADYLRRSFESENRAVSQTDPRFGDPAQLEAAYRNMLRRYNRRGDYPNEVLAFARGFAPVPATSIFD